MSQKPVILIVDDEPININVVAELLSDRYTIKVATNGIKALEIIQNQKPDLILLDIHMPQMDGYDVARAIKSNPSISKIPFIFLTSKQDNNSIVMGFKLGASDYITKPFNKEELHVRVDNHIHAHLLQRELNITLEQSKNNLKIIDSYVAFVRTDLEGIALEVSSRMCRYLHCQPEDIIGKKMSIVRSESTKKEIYKRLWGTIKNKETYVVEIENKNFNGTTNWYRATISPHINIYNKHIGYMAFYDNIDEKVEVKRLSETDKLTKLYNRAKIDTLLESEMERAERYGQPLSILMLDIDFFKSINDNYGHHIGDLILQEFAAILQKGVRKVDFAGRWGGEEFLIISPNTDSRQASILAEKLRLSIEKHTFSNGIKRTSSIGIAQYDINEESSALFKRADDALYEAKKSGRNKVVVK